MSLATSASVPLANLPLRPSTLEVFQQRGFHTTSEVAKSRKDGGLANLAAELGCSLRQATDYVREIQGCLTTILTTPSQRNRNMNHNGVDLERSSEGNNNNNNNNNNSQGNGLRALTASQLLENKSSSTNSKFQPRNLVTFCRSIDSLLGGGIGMGEVTEIAGSPGCGKTQLATQLSVDARLPEDFGGVAGETVYIDTEGNFSPERCYTMAQALVGHVRKSAERKNRQNTVPDWFDPDTIMKGIHVYRAHDEAAQTAIIMALPNFLQQRKDNGCPVKLVVVDSIAFHYRCAPPQGNFMQRTRSLSTVASHLSDLASEFEVAVVVINQMTTKFGMPNPTSTGESQSRLVPALGESWAHATTTRLVLAMPSSTNNQVHRTCTLVKSPHKPCGTATYKVLECGIRDIDTRDTSAVAMQEADNAKRPRTH